MFAQLPERPEGQAELLELLHAPIRLRAVVPLGMDPEPGQELLDRDVVGVPGELLAGGQPLGDDLVVLLLRCLLAVLAEVDGLAAQDDVALAAGLVMT